MIFHPYLVDNIVKAVDDERNVNSSKKHWKYPEIFLKINIDRIVFTC